MVEEQKLKMEKDREKEQKKEEVSQETHSPSLQDDCLVMYMSYFLLFHPCPELIFFYDKVRMQRVVIG